VLNGRNNDFYLDIIDRNNGSPTNNAIINSYVSLIYGKGLMDSNGANNVSNWLKFKTMISPKEVRKIVSDFKLFGEASIQVIKANRRNELPTLLHLPKNKVVPSIENEDGIIEGYWYCKDWQHKNQNPPEYYPAFGTSNENIEIYNIKPYTAGKEYFSDPDWLSGFAYAIMEEEISNLYVNCIKRGLSAGYIVNIPDGNSLTDEEKDRLEKQIKQKLTGSSNAGTFVINFKGGTEDITVTVMPVNDNIHKQWEYLTTEARQQLLTAHQVTSPIVFVINTGSGLGNNAEELKTASLLMDNTVIRPFQTLLINAFDDILAYNDISLNLYFKTLQPLEFKDLDNVVDEETREEETGVKLSKENEGFNDDEMLDALDGEDISDEWELVEKREYSEDNESTEDWASKLIKEKKTGLQKLADFIKSKPNDKSKLDKSFYKVRYEYSEKYSSGNSRNFCKTMMGRTSKGVVYRKEDIDQASFSGVNKSFGHKGNNYSLFKFKGGVNCGHYWSENLYMLKIGSAQV